MAVKSLTPNLIVPDVARTVDYYRDLLGFEFSLGVLEGTADAAFEYTGQPLAFAIIQRDQVELMLQSADSVAEDLGDYRPGSGDVVALYYDVDDVDSLRAQIPDDVEVIVEMSETFYGSREFHLRDCNGVIVGFAQRLNRQ